MHSKLPNDFIFEELLSLIEDLGLSVNKRLDALEARPGGVENVTIEGDHLVVEQANGRIDRTPIKKATRAKPPKVAT